MSSQNRALPYTPSAREALLKWVCDTSYPRTRSPIRGAQANPNNNQVNAFPDVEPANTWTDLADGVLLSQVLLDLDEQYDAADIDRDPPPSTPKWLVKKKNLQALHKAVFRYIHRECPEFEPLVKSADWRTLAEDPNEESLIKVDPRDRCVHVAAYEERLTPIIIQLVSIIVAVAFLGPDPGKYVRRLQISTQFDDNTKVEIQQIIMEKDTEAKKAAEMADLDDSIDQVMDSRDTGLAFEEERATLLSQLEVAKKQHADTITRLEHLQDSYDSLRLEETKLQRDLEVLRKATRDGASGSQVVKSLEEKISELEELIATQEGQLDDDRITKEKLYHQVASLTQKAEQAEQMDDELRELRHQTTELTRKANAAERLRQKLEQQQGLATEVDNLKYEKEQLLKKTHEYDRLQQKIGALERTIEEVRSTHAQAEETVFLLTNQKRMIEDTSRLAQEEVTQLKELRAHDERFIAELQEQAGLSNESGQSLEDELEGTPSAPGLSLEVSRLRAENALLKRNADTGETPQLRLELEAMESKMSELQSNYTEIVERHAVAQDQISSLVNDAAGEGSVSKRAEALLGLQAVVLNDDYYRTRAFGQLRTQLMQTHVDVKREKQRGDDLETQVADRDRDLLMARTELSAAAKGGVEALEELKATDGLISTSLREELDLARARNKSLADELETSKTQLIEAFVAKDKFRKELDELTGVKRVDEPSISDETIAQDVGKMTEKIEKLRERLLTRQEVSNGPLSPANKYKLLELVSPRAEEPEERPCTPFGSGPPSEKRASCESLGRRPSVGRADNWTFGSEPPAGKPNWAPGKGHKLNQPRKADVFMRWLWTS